MAGRREIMQVELFGFKWRIREVSKEELEEAVDKWVGDGEPSHGLCVPATRELLVLEGFKEPFRALIVLHELTHAADSILGPCTLDERQVHMVALFLAEVICKNPQLVEYVRKAFREQELSERGEG